MVGRPPLQILYLTGDEEGCQKLAIILNVTRDMTIELLKERHILPCFSVHRAIIQTYRRSRRQRECLGTKCSLTFGSPNGTVTTVG